MTTNADVVADDGRLSLREAVTAANTNAAFSDAPAGDSAGLDRVRIDPSLGRSTFALRESLPITDGVVLLASGATLSGRNFAGSVIDVRVGTREQVIIDSAVVRDGSNVSGSFVSGGGIRFAGSFGGRADSSTNFGIRGGRLRGNAARFGGGVYQHGGRSVVRGVSFINNRADDIGGGFRVFQGNASVEASIFQTNHADRFGGGLSADASTTTVTQSRFLGNDTGVAGLTAGQGGGVNVFRGNMRLVDAVFTGNSATGSGGGLEAESDAAIDVTRGTFDRNRASNDGGAVSVQNADLIARETLFVDNRAGDFAGAVSVALPRGRAVLLNTEVVANLAARGGGLASGDGQALLDLRGGVVRNNRALRDDGGGIAVVSGGRLETNGTDIRNNAAARFGGGLFNDNSAVLTNSRVFGNAVGSEGGGIFTDRRAVTTLRGTGVFGNRPDDLAGFGTVR